MKVVVGHVKRKMPPAVGRACRLRKLGDFVKHDALSAGHGHDGESGVAFAQREFEKMCIETDTGIEIDGVEMEMVELGRTGAVASEQLEGVVFRVGKGDALACAAAAGASFF